MSVFFHYLSTKKRLLMKNTSQKISLMIGKLGTNYGFEKEKLLVKQN